MRTYPVLLLFGALLLPLLAFKCIEPCVAGLVPFRHIDWTVQTIDNSGAAPLVRTGDLFPRQAFGLRISAGATLSNPLDTVGITCPEFVADTPIVDAKVLALSRFDAQHPAGSDISAFFKVRQTVGQPPGTRLSNAFVNYQPLRSIGELLNQYEGAGYADLLLLLPPDESYTGAFEIQLIRADSSKVVLATAVITLSN